MTEALAVIKNFHIGVGDRGVPNIWFDAYVNESAAALQVIYGAEEISNFIQEVGSRDVSSVEGRTCWVEADNSTIRFLRLAKI